MTFDGAVSYDFCHGLLALRKSHFNPAAVVGL